MKKQGKLREEDQGIRAYVKYPAVVKYPAALMVKRPGEAPCTSYAEYYIKKKKKILYLILTNRDVLCLPDFFTTTLPFYPLSSIL